MADRRAALAAAPDAVVALFVTCLPSLDVARLLRVCSSLLQAVRAQLPAELVRRGAASCLAALHFGELAWDAKRAPWTLQPPSHFTRIRGPEELAELVEALSPDLVLAKGAHGLREGLRLVKLYDPHERKVQCLGDLEGAQLPAALVFGGFFECIRAEDYADAWSADAERQRRGLRSLAGLVGRAADLLEDYGLWECELAAELYACGLQRRAGELLGRPGMELDALRVLRLVVLDAKPSAAWHQECAELLSAQRRALLRCLGAPDPALQACAVDVAVLAGGWLEGARADADLAAQLFTAILAFLMRLERQTQSGTLADERPRGHALSVPVQGLLLLSGGARELHGPGLPERLAPGCAVALAARLAQLLPEAHDVPAQGFPELSLGAICHLLCCLLASEEGCAVAAATPGLCGAMIGALPHCVHPHDRLCTTSPCRPLLKLAQYQRGVLLQCGALPAIFEIVAKWWWRPPECLERLIDVLHTPRMLRGAVVFARHRFSPPAESGFLSLLPGDEIEVLTQEGLWAWGRKASSPFSSGWFPEALVDALR